LNTKILLCFSIVWLVFWCGVSGWLVAAGLGHVCVGCRWFKMNKGCLSDFSMKEEA
jgi:hypothetical protein